MLVQDLAVVMVHHLVRPSAHWLEQVMVLVTAVHLVMDLVPQLAPETAPMKVLG
jgi:hypothetical protein